MGSNIVYCNNFLFVPLFCFRNNSTEVSKNQLALVSALQFLMALKNDRHIDNNNSIVLDLSMKNKRNVSSTESRKRSFDSHATSSDESDFPSEKPNSKSIKIPRKLHFDEIKSLPVSGTVIRQSFDLQEVQKIHRGIFSKLISRLSLKQIFQCGFRINTTIKITKHILS
jgi:hypothetical protein